MQKSFMLVLLLLAAKAQGQGSYCTQNLYVNTLNCLTKINQPGDTAWHTRIEDFSLWGEGSSVLQDLNTGCSVSGPGLPSSPGFSDRTHLTPVEVSAGKEYTARIFVVNGSHFQSTNVQEFYLGNIFARVDFNQNFVFDTTESILKPTVDTTFSDRYTYSLSFGTTPKPVYFKIRIPTGTPLGVYRMRIQEGAGASPNGRLDSLCGRYLTGETHDYKIKVVQPLGVENAATANVALSVHPQPANTEAFVGLPARENGEVMVSDVYGRLWLRRTISGNEEAMHLQTASWPTGAYFIHFSGARSSATARLLVVH